MHYRPAPFIGRDSLGRFFRENCPNPHGLGVEIGAHKGVYTRQLAMEWSGSLVSIDHYKQDYHPIDPAGKGDRHSDKIEAMNRIKDYPFCKLVLGDSVSIAADMEDKLLQFVYIDGNHDEFLQDLNAWYPKVVSGGFISGHDIICVDARPDEDWGRRIQQELSQYLQDWDLVVYLVPERILADQNWSFYFRKP